MICRILLLIILNSCVCAATFEVNVTQSSYQAEENHNITLEWTFTTKPGMSFTSLDVLCYMRSDKKVSVLYRLHEGVEESESQDERFKGRVQGDKDVLRAGRISLHVSRLRTDDSGLYQCDVNTQFGFRSDRCELSVTAAADQPQTQRPTLSPEPETRGRRRGPAVAAVPSVTAVIYLCITFYVAFIITQKQISCTAVNTQRDNL